MGQTEVEMGTMDEAESIDENSQTQMQEEYLKALEQLEEGQLVTGTVMQIVADQVFVDVNYKSEGKIPIGEFDEVPKIGDTVSVILEKKENKYGEVVVSKQKADAKLAWKEIKQAYNDHLPISAVIEKVIKGGYDVRLVGDIHAFLPISQADVKHIDKPESIVGETLDVYIERFYSSSKPNLVVNHRKLLEETVENKRAEFFATVPVGSEIDGVVKSFTSFGAFVDLGGFDGLLHIHDMSWGHVMRPKDFVKRGQKIKVKVIRIDPEEKRINLSLKHFTDDPWVHFQDKYHVNDIVKGKVTKLTDFGAFIELEEGIEGLAHISEFSWVKKVQKANEIVNIGDEVECMILGYDLQAGRVSLGLKQVKANPWNNLADRYPVGARLTRKVVKITNAGAFVQLEEGIDGFLHVDDLSWTRKIKHPSSEFKVGQEIDVIVLVSDAKERNIRLGVKQLADDPWSSFASTYKPGAVIEGEVSSITDFGVFIKIPGNIEGLIHKFNLADKKEADAEDALKKYKVGDKVNAILMEVQPDKRKAAFSVRDYKKKTQRDEISRYMAAEESDDSKITLGDMLKSRNS
jgi:small subunit ribosomal protein S1